MLLRLRRLLWVAVAAFFGLVAGCIGGAAEHMLPKPIDYPFLTQRTPLPHHVPAHAGGTSFRFAMAHDVIHERYPKHGPAYYREREQLTRLKLTNSIPDSPDWYAFNDDLAAALERLGRGDEAIELMRKKLARQQAAGLSDSELYTSYANLGTFLMHNSFPTMSRNPAAKQNFREGLELVEKGVAVNPAAHFNRERWEVTFGEFLLLITENSGMLQNVDCLGNQLDDSIDWIGTAYGRPTDDKFNRINVQYELPEFLRPDVKPDDPKQWVALSPIRKHITRIGGETTHGKGTIPFDEPMLGIVGLWRQETGPNAHFALAIGETMLRVGQRYIAWVAFERAYQLAQQFSPEDAVRQSLRDHCRKRQADIEETLMSVPRDRGPAWQNVSPPITREQVSEMRPRFEAELAYGQAFQRSYQEYEERKIAAGASIADEHFFDDFYTGREPIASRVGEEEWFVWVPNGRINRYAAWRPWSWGVFGAGIAAILMAGFIRWRAARQSSHST